MKTARWTVLSLLAALSGPACVVEEAPEPTEAAAADVPAPTDPARAAGPWAAYEKESVEDLRARLTDLQFRVTQEDGTERPFRNEYWDKKEAGIYVDVVSGEPLFSSADKFDSGTGWPSFTRPLVPANIARDVDYKIGYARTEVRSARADSHLGHVFEDGPPPTGLRYCINSAALRFVPAADLEREGYGAFAPALEGAAEPEVSSRRP